MPDQTPRVAVVIEDDADIRNLLEAILGQAGFTCRTTDSGLAGIEAVREHQPILTTLDVSLPGIDGFEVARRIRAFSGTYIIMLSARDEEIDTLMGLDAGADDYLTKPYQPQELFERVRTALLRTTIQGESVFEAGDLVVDLSRQTVRIGNNQIQLTDPEYELLRVLVLNAGKLMTQHQLASDVWGGHDITVLQLLRTTIGSLRQKLEADPARPSHIATEPGVGFRLRTEP